MRDAKSEVLDFWFDETAPVQWFQKNEEFDALVKKRFHDVYERAINLTYADWRNSPDGVLALCIILDQFPRNMFRNMPQSFATDAMALDIARDAIQKGFDQVLSPVQRRFLYLPFEHSEKIEDQRRAVALFETMREVDPLGYEYALRHLHTIKRFGRFPHRNAILGRENTPEEKLYLEEPGAGF